MPTIVKNFDNSTSPFMPIQLSSELVDWVSPVDNSSNRGAERLWLDSSVCGASPHHPTTALLLKGSKFILRKIVGVNRSSPALFPFLFGLFVGLLVGRLRDKRYYPRSRASVVASKTQFISILAVIPLWVWRNVVWTLRILPRNDKPLIDSNLERICDDRRESGVDFSATPKHVAVIMDGNRRYGRTKYGSAAKGHLDGCKTLVDFAEWCMVEGIEVLTVYAFSTENWNRDPAEIASLMSLFCTYCEELLVEAKQRNMRLCVLSTETERIPEKVMVGLRRMAEETKDCHGGLTMNICLSYGSRGEIVNACRELASDVLDGKIQIEHIRENNIRDRLLTSHCKDPDVVIRTSGEFRLSNFLLWQLAYSELFFIPKQWPQIRKEDLIAVIRSYAEGRSRRFGK